jgi:23S rRNA (cytosine1962-C5)-methyltransferase
MNKLKQGILRLNKKRERSVLNGHPWIFSGAVKELQHVTQNGQTVRVMSSEDEFLGMASVSLQSQIRARMWSRKDEPVDDSFFRSKIHVAAQRRKSLLIPDTTDAYRLINAESDELPGVIIDKYAETLVCQFLSAGAEFFREEILHELKSKFEPKVIFERSDSEARLKEGLEKRSGLLYGSPAGDEVLIAENGLKYQVNVAEGHKTGFYMDQRDNRKILSAFTRDAEVLNCFSYTGGFGISALAGGAKRVTNIDTSARVLELAGKNAGLNGFDAAKVVNIPGDVFVELRTFRDRDISFDVVVLDPPKFAESVSQIEKAARGYKDINLLAMKLIRPGGLLFTFSCSGHMSPELFRKVVSDAASDAGRTVQLVQFLKQSDDHPVILNFPEGLYLKGFICRVW